MDCFFLVLFFFEVERERERERERGREGEGEGGREREEKKKLTLSLFPSLSDRKKKTEKKNGKKPKIHNFQQIEAAWAVADRLNLIGPCCEQPQYNLLERKKIEDEFLPLFETRGTGTTTWSPLSSGVLTGKYGKGVPEGSRLSIEKYKTMLAGKLLAPEVLGKVEKLRPNLFQQSLPLQPRSVNTLMNVL